MKRRAYTEIEDEYLRLNYPRPEIFVSRMAAELDRSERSIYSRARLLSLGKPYECRSISGKLGAQHPDSVAHRFSKGHVPFNKGKQLSPDTYAKLAPTMFKPGIRPHNTARVGDEAVRKGGYVWVKVAEPNKWKAKHRILWESVNGPVPRGCNIQFKNGDVSDIRIENLYVISRSDQLRRENSLMARYPEELQRVIRLKGSLKRHITMQNRKENE